MGFFVCVFLSTGKVLENGEWGVLRVPTCREAVSLSAFTECYRGPNPHPKSLFQARDIVLSLLPWPFMSTGPLFLKRVNHHFLLLQWMEALP